MSTARIHRPYSRVLETHYPRSRLVNTARVLGQSKDALYTHDYSPYRRILVNGRKFSQLTADCRRACPGMFSPKNCPFTWGSRPHRIMPPWATQVQCPNGISIGSTVVAQFMSECRRACRGMSFALKVAPSHGRSVSYLIRDSLGPPDSARRTASRSVQPFLHSSMQTLPILYTGRPFHPKLILPMGSGSHLT